MSPKPIPTLIPRLIQITDSARFPGERFDDALEQALVAGLPGVLLREKGLDSAKLLARASVLRALTARYGARLYIHSQADVALAVGADGVHLGSRDIGEIPAMRRWLGSADMTLSASCHDAGEIAQANRAEADFIFLSPLFPTLSHPGAPALGVAGFNRLAALSQVPVVALGGIDGPIPELAAHGVAVIGAIAGADDPALQTQHLLAAFSPH